MARRFRIFILIVIFVGLTNSVDDELSEENLESSCSFPAGPEEILWIGEAPRGQSPPLHPAVPEARGKAPLRPTGTLREPCSFTAPYGSAKLSEARQSSANPLGDEAITVSRQGTQTDKSQLEIDSVSENDTSNLLVNLTSLHLTNDNERKFGIYALPASCYGFHAMAESSDQKLVGEAQQHNEFQCKNKIVEAESNFRLQLMETLLWKQADRYRGVTEPKFIL